MLKYLTRHQVESPSLCGQCKFRLLYHISRNTQSSIRHLRRSHRGCRHHRDRQAEAHDTPMALGAFQADAISDGRCSLSAHH